MPTEILVVREKDRFSSILIEQGLAVTNFPVIKTEPLVDLSELEDYLARIECFDGIFITSLAAAEIVHKKTAEIDKSIATKFYVLGKRSDEFLKNKGYKTFFDERATTAEELLKIIPAEELANKKFLFVCGNRSLLTIPEKLENIAEVCQTIVYKTSAASSNEKNSDKVKQKIDAGKIRAICFFSPSAVAEFIKRFADFEQGKTKIAAIGQTTADFIAKSEMRVDLVSSNPSAEVFAAELADHLRKGI